MKLFRNKKLTGLLATFSFMLVFNTIVSSLVATFVTYKIVKNPQIIENISNMIQTKPEKELNNDEIMKIIIEENPNLKSGKLSEFEIVNELREWVFKNVPVVFYDESLRVENFLNVSSANQIP